MQKVKNTHETHTASTVTLSSQQQGQGNLLKPKQAFVSKSHQLQSLNNEQQLQWNKIIPGKINYLPSSRKTLNNNNDNNLLAVRRIRKPYLWMGNVEKAKKQRQHKQQQWEALRNKMNNTDNMNFDNDSTKEIIGDLSQRQIRCRSLISKIKSFIIEYLLDSSIHGFEYLAKIGLTFVERTLWFAFICVAIFSIISLSARTWHRFQTSPMVISMDRNKLVWNTSFPSLTVCPHKRIDELKVEEYIMSHSDIFTTDEDKEGFKDFVDKLARLSYDNIEQLPTNKTYGIPSDNYLDLIYELKWQFEPEISSGAAVKMYIYETQTEFGICHSVNSLVARYNSYEYWRSNSWDILDHGERVTVHPLDGEIYAQIINLSTAYDVYFHSSGDIPSITKQRYTFPETDYTTVELIALEITTDEAAKAFSAKQRKCRFKYEAEEMQTVPIYSFGLCLAECRLFLALKVCHCVPHFYRNTLRNGRVLPVCGLRGLACVAKLKHEMISLKSKRYKINCNCLANCDDSNFFVQSYRSRVWFLGANLQWGVIDYPKMQLRRDVIFSFADVLVYIGGLVGFFLGCSALSFIELIYYFTIRLARRIMAN
ncbi:pickpocket 9 [Cochliomyia hominivorax]